MKLTTGPRMFDPRLPEVQSAIAEIRLKLKAVRQERPDFTALQALQQARARCVPAILTAITAVDYRSARYGGCGGGG